MIKVLWCSHISQMFPQSSEARTPNRPRDLLWPGGWSSIYYGAEAGAASQIQWWWWHWGWQWSDIQYPTQLTMEYIVMKKTASNNCGLCHNRYYCWDWKTSSNTATSDNQSSHLNRKGKRLWYKSIHQSSWHHASYVLCVGSRVINFRTMLS